MAAAQRGPTGPRVAVGLPTALAGGGPRSQVRARKGLHLTPVCCYGTAGCGARLPLRRSGACAADVLPIRAWSPQPVCGNRRTTTFRARCRGQPAAGGSRVIPAPPAGALGRRAGLSEPARAAATAFYRAHHSERSEFVPSEEASACAPHPDPRRTAAGLMGGGGRLLANPVGGVEHDGRARFPGGVGLGFTAVVGAGGPRLLAAILRRRTGLPGSRGCLGWAGSRRAGQADGRGSAPQPAAKRCRDSVWRVATLRACGHGGRARLWTRVGSCLLRLQCGLAPGSVCTVQ